ncbi:IS4 family transposase [Paenibacillus donghaensis]|uniref:IS4 family transposase n=1 Tax=Paenibacillus donghaensis TaxID=414771 RepID=UPI0012FCD117|nr:IS4 family transposase [Paenibacillus donghaensis]
MTTKLAEQGLLCQVTTWLNRQASLLFGDRYAKKLKWGSTVFLFLEAILSGRTGTQAIVDHLLSSPWLQKCTGIESIHQSSLNRKLGDLPPEVLGELYLSVLQHLLEQKGPAPPKKLQKLGPLAVLDSTSLTLGRVRGKWAYLQSGKNAVKMHTCLHLTGEHTAIPMAPVLSTAAVADLDTEVVDALVPDKGVTCLVDRGYIHYAQYLKWQEEGIHFVARLKQNSQVKVLRTRKVTAAELVLDADVELKCPKTGKTGVFRLVEYLYTDKKGKRHRVRVLTNRWDVKAMEVAQLYRYRWKVELFFKFMKSSLHLKKIYSSRTSEAVWNLIYLNLIAYVLCEELRLRYAPQERIGRVLAVFRLYLSGTLADFLKHLNRAKERTSKGRRNKGGRPQTRAKRLKPQRILFHSVMNN